MAATVSDVVPWWGFLVLIGGILLIVAIAVILWRKMRHAEYRVIIIFGRLG